jgi:sugar lactone lactonase YvrE
MNGVDISVDGLVYVCDRGGDRVQIFTKEGKFVKEFLISPKTTLGSGSVWSTMFSRDAKQKYLYVADGTNGMIRILNREDGMQVGSFGHKGHQAGEFDSVERMGLDSKGNLYVTEVNHNTRLQKFAPVK